MYISFLFGNGCIYASLLRGQMQAIFTCTQKATFPKRNCPSSCQSLGLSFRAAIAMKRCPSGTRSPKRKGGVRQRMQARRDENWVLGTSALTALLVSLFAWGEMSPQLAQKIALAAFEDAVKFKDGVTSLEELRKIGDIGSRGFYPNKCYFEFISAIPMKINIPEAMSCRLPFKTPLGMLNQCMLWPHELFSAIYNFYKGTWRRSILPSQERLKEFWRTNRLHPSFFASEVKLIPDFDQWVVPLSIMEMRCL